MRKGWLWPRNTKKAHYFVEDKEQSSFALCGKMAMLFTPTEEIFSNVEDDKHNSKDNCKECNRKRIKLGYDK